MGARSPLKRAAELVIIAYVVLALQACKTPVKVKVSRSNKFGLRFQIAAEARQYVGVSDFQHRYPKRGMMLLK